MGYGFNGFFVIILRSLVVLFKLFVAKLVKISVSQRLCEFFVDDQAEFCNIGNTRFVVGTDGALEFKIAIKVLKKTPKSLKNSKIPRQEGQISNKSPIFAKLK